MAKRFRTLTAANAWLVKNWKIVDAHAKASTKKLIGRTDVAKAKKAKQKHPKFPKTQINIYSDEGGFITGHHDPYECLVEALACAEEHEPSYILTYTLSKVEFVGHRKGTIPVVDITNEVV